MTESEFLVNFRTLRQNVFIFLITVFFVCVLPGLALIVAGMVLIRACASKLAPVVRPDLGRILGPSSASFAVDLLYKKVQHLPLIITVYLDGTLDIETFRSAVKRVMADRDPVTGDIVRPELQQYVTSWFGLLFWKWDRSFDLTNHVRIFTEHNSRPSINEDDLLEIGNEMLEKPFEPNKSPWEFLVLYNTREKIDRSHDPRTTVVMRVHHGLGDGYSLLKLVMEDMSNVELRLAKPKDATQPVSGNVRGHWSEKVIYPLRAAYDLANIIVKCYDVNDWRIPESQMSRRMNGGVSQSIPLEFVKEIKADYGVTFTAVLLAAFTGGIRNFMLGRKTRIPDSIHCFTILPFPNHPFNLTNHMTGGFARLPLGEKSPQKRLEAIEANLQELRTSTVPTTLFYLMKLAGIQFTFFTNLFFRNILTTALMSNFPGPETQVNFIGLPILDGGFAAGFGPGNATVGFTALSYNGGLRLAAGFDEAVLPRSIRFQSLIDSVVEEFHVLAKRSSKQKSKHCAEQ